MNISIREGTPKEVAKLTWQIPEFLHPYKAIDYKERTSGKEYLFLIAEAEGKQVGFKAGYALSDKTFYSWMGGVLPDFRGYKIASKLAGEQEKKLKKMGFSTIRLKTRNRHKAMIQFLLKNNFYIIDCNKKGEVPDFRIIFEKRL